MLHHTTQLRVRYAETDQMGYAYYGNYATYFEVARSTMVRDLSVPYDVMETRDGIMLPVIELQVHYKRPAHYEQLLTIHTRIEELPSVRIRFDHEVYNEAQQLLATGYVRLAFTHRHNGRPCRPPAYFLDALRAQWRAPV
jgi:acyl-CoA thioester hydrolase